MTTVEIATWVLRIIGAAYFLGGLFGMRQAFFMLRAEPSMDELLDTLDKYSAENEGRDAPPPRVTDSGRMWWLLSGAFVLTLAGGAMMAAHRSAAVLLALILVHQMLYFVRQRRRELAAPNEDQASEARPARATINGFLSSIPVVLLAAWLFHRGALW